MADTKLSALTALTAANVATDDELYIGDTSAGPASKRITVAEARKALQVRNIVRAKLHTAFSTTAIIPIDNTIPQIGEGGEVLTADITPTSTTSWIRAVAVVHFNPSVATSGVAAMFVEGASNAVAANYATLNGAAFITPVIIDYQYIPGTTDTQTIAVRIGPSAAATLRVNSIGTDIFNGVSYGAVLTLEEIHV
jgi:hypothetical protein